jgi:hypothetical protein
MSTLSGGPNVVMDGLVLYLDAGNRISYTGTGTVWSDISRGGNNGTLTNGPTFNANNGGSISFDGTNDYVSTGIINAFGTDLYTYEAWINFTASQVGAIISKRTPTNFEMLSFFIAGNNNGGQAGKKIAVYHNASNALRTTVTDLEYGDSKWHYVALVVTSTTDIIYVDGVAVKSTTLTAVPNLTATPPLYVGGSNDSSSAPYVSVNSLFNGSISIVKIYNRALSATEVLQNYNATKGRFGL